MKTRWLLVPVYAVATFVGVCLPTAPVMKAQSSETGSGSSAPALPYHPSLDLTAMDTSVEPCVDFYQYSCAGWQKANPIPPDRTSWSVYGKLYEDNLGLLRGILEQ